MSIYCPFRQLSKLYNFKIKKPYLKLGFYKHQILDIKKPAYAGFLLHQTSEVGMVPEARLELALLCVWGFKSPVSTDFTTRALLMR